MTTTVFLSGSRKISRLNESIRCRIQKMIDQNFCIIVGDANGADKALQKYLAEKKYINVVVFCAGDVCRNNVGDWKTKAIEVSSNLKGREFYTQKDKAMASKADYGFVLWDGKSAGSFANVLELMKNDKPVVIYFAPEKMFYTPKNIDDVKYILQKIELDDYRSIVKNVNIEHVFKNLHITKQGELNF